MPGPPPPHPASPPPPHPARLTIGVIGAGRVGTVLGAALVRAGHRVVAVSAVSDASVERARRLMGSDFWPYGLERNAAVLRTFLGYARDQGLTNRDLEPTDLFVPETHTSYVI